MGKLLSFSMNYVFTCKFCSPTGLEIYRRSSSSLHQMCITAIANLQRKTVKDGAPRYLFSKDREIIPFIEAYWESITTLARKQTNAWYSTIQKTLQTNNFTSQDNAGDLMFGLVDQNLENIKPNYDKLSKDDGEFRARRFK
jgi:Set1/Ash2 histone methyltransferase complex subunit ASH2